MFTVIESNDLVENESVTAYGVKAPSGKTVYAITIVRSEAECFVDKLNRYEASEIHLSDLVYDFLCAK